MTFWSCGILRTQLLWAFFCSHFLLLMRLLRWGPYTISSFYFKSSNLLYQKYRSSLYFVFAASFKCIVKYSSQTSFNVFQTSVSKKLVLRSDQLVQMWLMYSFWGSVDHLSTFLYDIYIYIFYKSYINYVYIMHTLLICYTYIMYTIYIEVKRCYIFKKI